MAAVLHNYLECAFLLLAGRSNEFVSYFSQLTAAADAATPVSTACHTSDVLVTVQVATFESSQRWISLSR
jgi:hypothetical protein